MDGAASAADLAQPRGLLLQATCIGRRTIVGRRIWAARFTHTQAGSRWRTRLTSERGHFRNLTLLLSRPLMKR